MECYNVAYNKLTVKSKRRWYKCKCDSANRMSSDRMSSELDCTPIALVSLSVCGYTASLGVPSMLLCTVFIHVHCV